eukprot:TRINITY_DN375_c0_g1_i4.p1 TRINITY_DN375_c0_g1~~TRINITY_DN375_c0_g1_i4.p1  ORF type:complete len:568 (+),score=50.32 TRINITY_DN375_c0_g1_i4:83-1705(+)
MTSDQTIRNQDSLPLLDNKFFDNSATISLQKSLTPRDCDSSSSLPLPPGLLTHDPHPQVGVNISRIINPLHIFRVLLSKNRRRIVMKNFDLDLTYITDRIIAMSIPGITPLLSMVCNPYSKVKRFLDSYHPKNYKVYNLCLEYPYKGEELFDGNYGYFPSEDMQPPSLDCMYNLCVDALEWLDSSNEHIVVIHCKGGKGRTGCMVCALLCYLAVIKRGGYSKYQDPERALEHFADVRTVDGKGITRASQKNYVRRFSEIVRQWKLGMFEVVHPIQLLSVKISGLDDDLQRSGKFLIKLYFRRHGQPTAEKVVRAYINNKTLEQNKAQKLYKNRIYNISYMKGIIILDFTRLQQTSDTSWMTDGDIKVSVTMFRPRTKVIFYTWFSTMVLPNSGPIIATFGSLDKLYKKLLSKPSDIKVEVDYLKFDTMNIPSQNLYQEHLSHVQGPCESFESGLWDLEISMIKNKEDDREVEETLEEPISVVSDTLEQYTSNCSSKSKLDEDDEEDKFELKIPTQQDLIRFEIENDVTYLQQQDHKFKII